MTQDYEETLDVEFSNDTTQNPETANSVTSPDDPADPDDSEIVADELAEPGDSPLDEDEAVAEEPTDAAVEEKPEVGVVEVETEDSQSQEFAEAGEDEEFASEMEAEQDPAEDDFLEEKPEVGVVEVETEDSQTQEFIEAGEDDELTSEMEAEQDPAEDDFVDEAEAAGLAPTAETVVEAVLFASDEPLTVERLAKIAETSVKQIRKYVAALNARYEQINCAFRIEKIAGGYQMLTLSTYNHWLKKLLRVRGDNKLSAAALETLAIIAYKQPIIRADIEAIRGVATGEMIRGLMYKGLVRIVGRAEVLGRPMLYGTTRKFLEVFGLNSLKDLPKVEELKKPDA